MDSHIVVGVGNIYASESLFKAGVIPSKLGKDTSLDECTKIVKHIKATLIKAIELGGSSLKDFYNVNGQSGYFQQTYNVYGMKGKPCRKCKSIIESIKIGQRSSFFCIKCQN
jgi:formamidopyrimidine-DNA glycosylase